VLARLDGLVAKSLVQVEEAGEELRYRLLESVRAFAQELGEAAGELDAVRERHLRWYLALAEELGPWLFDRDIGAVASRLAVEHASMRAALAWSLREGHHAAYGLRLAAALWRFWQMRGHWSEGRRWLSMALAGANGEPAARLSALHGLAKLAEEQWDMAQARSAQEERLALARSVEDDNETIGALYGLGLTLVDEAAMFAGRGESGTQATAIFQATALFEESLELARGLGHQRGMGGALSCLALLAQQGGAPEHALTLLEESLEHYRAAGNEWMVARTQFNLAFLQYKLGNEQRAEELCAALLALYGSLQDTRGVAAVHELLGRLAIRQHDYAAARAHLQCCLGPFLELDAKGLLVDALEHLAVVAAAGGQPAWCLRLLGAADTLLGSIGQPPDDHAALVPRFAELVAQLGSDACAAALAEGRSMTMEQAASGAQALCVALAGSPEAPGHDVLCS